MSIYVHARSRRRRARAGNCACAFVHQRAAPTSKKAAALDNNTVLPQLLHVMGGKYSYIAWGYGYLVVLAILTFTNATVHETGEVSKIVIAIS